jgi:hypothetical protein
VGIGKVELLGNEKAAFMLGGLPDFKIVGVKRPSSRAV